MKQLIGCNALHSLSLVRALMPFISVIVKSGKLSHSVMFPCFLDRSRH